jgi:hypothetical protein
MESLGSGAASCPYEANGAAAKIDSVAAKTELYLMLNPLHKMYQIIFDFRTLAHNGPV